MFSKLYIKKHILPDKNINLNKITLTVKEEINHIFQHAMLYQNKGKQC